MQSALSAIEQLISSLDKLRRTVSQGHSKQVIGETERLNIKAVTYTWLQTLRPSLNHSSTFVLLGPIDKGFNELLEYSDRATSRNKYKSHLKSLKAEAIRLRAQVTVLTSSGQMPSGKKPDFSKLISKKELLAVVDRRWDETNNCINGAPLAATIMIGALLEALLFSRIEREKNKDQIFALKSTPQDKTGKAKDLREWTLSDYINICFEIGWIRRPVKDIGVVLRDYRNLIHPREELKQGVPLTPDDAKLYWAVFSGIAEQIVASIN